MTPWTRDEINELRRAKFYHHTMADMVSQFSYRHDRDEVVEALDALVRHPRDAAAREHVNYVLMMQDAGIQLINGKPVTVVAKNWPAPTSWPAMF